MQRSGPQAFTQQTVHDAPGRAAETGCCSVTLRNEQAHAFAVGFAGLRCVVGCFGHFVVLMGVVVHVQPRAGACFVKFAAARLHPNVFARSAAGDIPGPDLSYRLRSYSIASKDIVLEDIVLRIIRFSRRAWLGVIAASGQPSLLT